MAGNDAVVPSQQIKRETSGANGANWDAQFAAVSGGSGFMLQGLDEFDGDDTSSTPSDGSMKRRRSMSGNEPMRQSQRATRGKRGKSYAEESDVPEAQERSDVQGSRQGNPTPKEISSMKYNHVEDEKERKRLKRLLRNRVSAQQARERKKAYLNNLEEYQKQTDNRIASLESRISSLTHENFMLRQVIKTKGLNNQVHHQEQMSPDDDGMVPVVMPGFNGIDGHIGMGHM